MPTTISRVICAAAVLLSLPSIADAQAVSDTEVWTTAGAEVDLPNKLRLGWSHSLRFDNDVDDLKSTFHQVALRFAANDYLRLRAGYRYYMVRNGIPAHRLYGDLSARYRPDSSKWRVGYRARLQNTTRPDPDEDLTYLRNRVSGSYELRDDVAPFVSFELYYRFRDQGPNEFRRYRVTAGTDWKVAKRTTVSVFYLFQKEMNVGSPEQDHVLGVELSYRIDRR